MTDVSVCLLAYNEEVGIESLLKQSVLFKNQLEMLFGFQEIEFLIVDDCSDPPIKLEDLEIPNSVNVRVVRHDVNRGYAKATESAIKSSHGKYIYVVDGDGQHPLTQIIEMHYFLRSGADLVLPNRFYRAERISRRYSSQVLKFLVRLILNVNVRDVNGGIKGISRNFAERIDDLQEANLVNPELLAIARFHTQRVVSVPVVQIERIDGTESRAISKPLGQLMKIVKYLFGLRWKYHSKIA